MGSQTTDTNKMRRIPILLLLPLYSIQTKTKSLTETEDAYILDVDLDDNTETKAANKDTQTRILATGNPLVDGAVVGIGVGVIGSLLIGGLLDKKKEKCFYRYRRDSANPASTRFLPANCPPPPYNNGYNPPVNGYNPPVNGYNPPVNGYNPPVN